MFHFLKAEKQLHLYTDSEVRVCFLLNLSTTGCPDKYININK